MPLAPGKSKRTWLRNVQTEMEAGKPRKQAEAIAYSKQGERKAPPPRSLPSAKGRPR